MATHRDDLITGYVAELDRALAGRIRHADRVALEIEDHLRSATEELRASGVAEDDAARRAIECFGPVSEVATPLLELERAGGGARPNRFTIWAGLLGAIGGLLIAVAAAAQTFGVGSGSLPKGLGEKIGIAIFWLAALGCTALGFAGIILRHRGTLRRRERLALGLLAIGFMTMWLPYWGILVIALPMMLIGTVVFGIRVFSVHVLPRPPLTLMLVAGAATIALTVTKVDKESLAFAAGWIFVLLGWCWLEFTLWSERPVNDSVPA